MEDLSNQVTSLQTTIKENEELISKLKAEKRKDIKQSKKLQEECTQKESQLKELKLLVHSFEERLISFEQMR